MSAPRILAIGAATQDVYLGGKVFKPVRDQGVLEEQFELGAKLDVDDIFFSTGGGASNAAVTFARQGLDSSFMGYIGHDPAGAAVLADFDTEHVDVNHVRYSEEQPTGYSVILLAPNGERTVLVYRGASAHYKVADLDLAHIDVDWLYLSSFAGQIDVLEALITQAAQKGIKVALNPGKGELKHAAKLRALLDDITVFGANKEEMAQLVEGKTAEELACHAAHYVDYAIVTDGPKGEVAVGDGKIVKGGMYDDVKVVDRLGAGDAFHSGFVSQIALGRSLEDAVVFASANSTAVVSTIGAKAGILGHDFKPKKMDITVKAFKK